MEAFNNSPNKDIENTLEMAQVLQDRLFSINNIEDQKQVAEQELGVLNMVIARDLGKTALIVDKVLGPPQDVNDFQEGPEIYREVIGAFRGFEALATDKLSLGANLYIFLAAETPSVELNNPFFYGKRIFRAPVVDNPVYTILDEAS